MTLEQLHIHTQRNKAWSKFQMSYIYQFKMDNRNKYKIVKVLEDLIEEDFVMWG